MLRKVLNLLTVVFFISTTQVVNGKEVTNFTLRKVKSSLWNQGTIPMGEAELLIDTPNNLERLPMIKMSRPLFEISVGLPEELQIPLKKSFFMEG